MSLPQQAFSPPPPAVAPYDSKDGWGSVGPVIGVLAAIAVLGILAGVIGRLCSGRRVVGLGPYDVPGWIERNCSACIDGGSGSPAAAAPAEEQAVRRGSEPEPEAKHSPEN